MSCILDDKDTIIEGVDNAILVHRHDTGWWEIWTDDGEVRLGVFEPNMTPEKIARFAMSMHERGEESGESRGRIAKELEIKRVLGI